jgi:hypothetical protein
MQMSRAVNEGNWPFSLFGSGGEGALAIQTGLSIPPKNRFPIPGAPERNMTDALYQLW